MNKVKSELLKIPGVTTAELQLHAPQAAISMDRHIAMAVLQEAVSRSGHYNLTAENMPAPAAIEPAATGDSYLPIFLIFGYILGVSLLAQAGSGAFDTMRWMRHFMGGFFLVFSFFKLMSLRGFAEGYRSYDIVAKAVPAYGFIYPFIELALGIAFITGFQPLLTNIAALVVMTVSTVGVVQSLVKKTPFQCACLGTVIKLPLSRVTLFEDALMVAMSAVMVVMLAGRG